MARKTFAILVAIFISSLLLSKGVEAAKIYKTINYYTISGTTPEQIDKSLTHKGPYLKNTGSHHPGATTISFIPRLKLEKQDRYCKVAAVSVDVSAKMSLPRWKQRRSTKSIEMAIVWDTLSQDIKRHEESHIVIARAHASKIEQIVSNLPSKTDCDKLRKEIEKISYNVMQQHDEAQKNFDRVEAINFEKRFGNLLMSRVEQLKKQTE